nr:hypothetical protein [Leptospira santarosai]
MLSGDFVFDTSLLQTILFALFAIMTLFQGRLVTTPPHPGKSGHKKTGGHGLSPVCLWSLYSLSFPAIK